MNSNNLLESISNIHQSLNEDNVLNLQEGCLYWIKDDAEIYLPAEFLAYHPTDQNICRFKTYQTEKRMNVQKQDVYGRILRPSSLEETVGDMVNCDDISESTVLWNIKTRFSRGQIYTNIGSILVSVNPYQWQADLYSDETLLAFSESKVGENVASHVWTVARAAIHGIKMDGVSQSIVISGESGAGKTEATKKCLQFFTEVSDQLEEVEGVEDRILSTNPLLESFGNAKTCRNNNSSRFGKYIDIFFTESPPLSSNMIISGAKIEQYLLEKSRVAFQPPEERNFHIFYQICVGGDQTLKSMLLLGENEDDENGSPFSYNYLNQSGCYSVDGIHDEDDFTETLEAIVALEFTKEETLNLLKICSSILHLGNIQFTSSGDSLVMEEEEEGDLKLDENGCVVSPQSREFMDNASTLLEINAFRLSEALRTRELYVANEKVTVTLSDEQSVDARDAFAKDIYGKLFAWIVQKINTSLSPSNDLQNQTTSRFLDPRFQNQQSNEKKSSRDDDLSIGVLDIFGFEIFEQNFFEQLCINFANEKLQEHFMQYVLKDEEAVYDKERIDFTPINFMDNTDVLNLFEERPNGLFSLLDEELIIPRGSDAGFHRKLTDKAASSERYYVSVHMKETQFAIRHYAGTVIYDSTSMLVKNKDKLHDHLLVLLSKSKNQLIQTLFPPPPQNKNASQASRSRKKKGDVSTMTLGTQFQNQLSDLLMNRLKKAAPHFIRCIKPNSLKSPDLFEGYLVMEQLRYSGVLEAIQIRKSGYPVRNSHYLFFLRYWFVPTDELNLNYDKLMEQENRDVIFNEEGNFPIDDDSQKEEEEGKNKENEVEDNGEELSSRYQKDSKYRELCIHLLRLLCEEDEMFNEVQIGLTLILFRPEQHSYLELKREIKLEVALICIQSYFRMILCQRRMEIFFTLRDEVKKWHQEKNRIELGEALKKCDDIEFSCFEILESHRYHDYLFAQEKARIELEKSLEIARDETIDILTQISSLKKALDLSNNLDLEAESMFMEAEKQIVNLKVKGDVVESLRNAFESQNILEIQDAIEKAKNVENEIGESFCSSDIDTSKDLLLQLKREEKLVTILQVTIMETRIQQFTNVSGIVSGLDMERVNVELISSRIAELEEINPTTSSGLRILESAKYMSHLRSCVIRGRWEEVSVLLTDTDYHLDELQDEILAIQIEMEQQRLIPQLQRCLEGDRASGEVGTIDKESLSIDLLRGVVENCEELSIQGVEVLRLLNEVKVTGILRDAWIHEDFAQILCLCDQCQIEIPLFLKEKYCITSQDFVCLCDLSSKETSQLVKDEFTFARDEAIDQLLKKCLKQELEVGCVFGHPGHVNISQIEFKNLCKLIGEVGEMITNHYSTSQELRQLIRYGSILAELRTIVFHDEWDKIPDFLSSSLVSIDSVPISSIREEIQLINDETEHQVAFKMLENALTTGRIQGQVGALNISTIHLEPLDNALRKIQKVSHLNDHERELIELSKVVYKLRVLLRQPGGCAWEKLHPILDLFPSKGLLKEVEVEVTLLRDEVHYQRTIDGLFTALTEPCPFGSKSGHMTLNISNFQRSLVATMRFFPFSSLPHSLFKQCKDFPEFTVALKEEEDDEEIDLERKGDDDGEEEEKSTQLIIQPPKLLENCSLSKGIEDLIISSYAIYLLRKLYPTLAWSRMLIILDWVYEAKLHQKLPLISNEIEKCHLEICNEIVIETCETALGVGLATFTPSGVNTSTVSLEPISEAFGICEKRGCPSELAESLFHFLHEIYEIRSAQLLDDWSGVQAILERVHISSSTTPIPKQAIQELELARNEVTNRIVQDQFRDAVLEGSINGIPCSIKYEKISYKSLDYILSQVFNNPTMNQNSMTKLMENVCKCVIELRNSFLNHSWEKVNIVQGEWFSSVEDTFKASFPKDKHILSSIQKEMKIGALEARTAFLREMLLTSLISGSATIKHVGIVDHSTIELTSLQKCLKDAEDLHNDISKMVITSTGRNQQSSHILPISPPTKLKRESTYQKFSSSNNGKEDEEEENILDYEFFPNEIVELLITCEIVLRIRKSLLETDWIAVQDVIHEVEGNKIHLSDLCDLEYKEAYNESLNRSIGHKLVMAMSRGCVVGEVMDLEVDQLSIDEISKVLVESEELRQCSAETTHLIFTAKGLLKLRSLLLESCRSKEEEKEEKVLIPSLNREEIDWDVVFDCCVQLIEAQPHPCAMKEISLIYEESQDSLHFYPLEKALGCGFAEGPVGEMIYDNIDVSKLDECIERSIHHSIKHDQTKELLLTGRSIRSLRSALLRCHDCSKNDSSSFWRKLTILQQSVMDQSEEEEEEEEEESTCSTTQEFHSVSEEAWRGVISSYETIQRQLDSSSFHVGFDICKDEIQRAKDEYDIQCVFHKIRHNQLIGLGSFGVIPGEINFQRLKESLSLLNSCKISLDLLSSFDSTVIFETEDIIESLIYVRQSMLQRNWNLVEEHVMMKLEEEEEDILENETEKEEEDSQVVNQQQVKYPSISLLYKKELELSLREAHNFHVCERVSNFLHNLDGLSEVDLDLMRDFVGKRTVSSEAALWWVECINHLNQFNQAHETGNHLDGEESLSWLMDMKENLPPKTKSVLEQLFLQFHNDLLKMILSEALEDGGAQETDSGFSYKEIKTEPLRIAIEKASKVDVLLPSISPLLDVGKVILSLRIAQKGHRVENMRRALEDADKMEDQFLTCPLSEEEVALARQDLDNQAAVSVLIRAIKTFDEQAARDVEENSWNEVEKSMKGEDEGNEEEEEEEEDIKKKREFKRRYSYANMNESNIDVNSIDVESILEAISTVSTTGIYSARGKYLLHTVQILKDLRLAMRRGNWDLVNQTLQRAYSEGFDPLAEKEIETVHSQLELRMTIIDLATSLNRLGPSHYSLQSQVKSPQKNDHLIPTSILEDCGVLQSSALDVKTLDNAILKAEKGVERIQALRRSAHSDSLEFSSSVDFFMSSPTNHNQNQHFLRELNGTIEEKGVVDYDSQEDFNQWIMSPPSSPTLSNKANDEDFSLSSTSRVTKVIDGAKKLLKVRSLLSRGGLEDAQEVVQLSILEGVDDLVLREFEFYDEKISSTLRSYDIMDGIERILVTESDWDLSELQDLMREAKDLNLSSASDPAISSLVERGMDKLRNGVHLIYGLNLLMKELVFHYPPLSSIQRKIRQCKDIGIGKHPLILFSSQISQFLQEDETSILIAISEYSLDGIQQILSKDQVSYAYHHSNDLVITLPHPFVLHTLQSHLLVLREDQFSPLAFQVGMIHGDSPIHTFQCYLWSLIGEFYNRSHPITIEECKSALDPTIFDNYSQEGKERMNLLVDQIIYSQTSQNVEGFVYFFLEMIMMDEDWVERIDTIYFQFIEILITPKSESKAYDEEGGSDHPIVNTWLVWGVFHQLCRSAPPPSNPTTTLLIVQFLFSFGRIDILMSFLLKLLLYSVRDVKFIQTENDENAKPLKEPKIWREVVLDQSTLFPQIPSLEQLVFDPNLCFQLFNKIFLHSPPIKPLDPRRVGWDLINGQFGYLPTVAEIKLWITSEKMKAIDI